MSESKQRQPGGVVVIGPWAWGHGADLKTAKKNFTDQGARLSDGYAVIELPDTVVFTYVDGFGGVHWRAADGVDVDPTTVEPKITEHPARKR